MHPQRRIKIFVAIAIAVLLILYYSGEARNIQNHKFYRTTVEAMEAREAAKHSAKDDDSLFQKLQPNKKPADGEVVISKPEGNNIPPKDSGEEQEMEEISVAGRTTMQVPKAKDKNASKQQGQEAEGGQDLTEAKDELDSILRRSPIIIFSKSYCPYSAKAKSILLDKYSIVPAPYVVELDRHPIGPKLQALLGQNTGRRTVPNVLVNGKSIGGGDDMAALDEKGELVSKLKTLGGSWLAEVNVNEKEKEKED